MKTLLILLTVLILISCGGKGGDASLHVIVWKADGVQQLTGELSITFNTKKTDPNKSPNLFFDMIDGSGDLRDLKVGNYLVTFESSEIGRCATQFKIPFESQVDIVLREGEFIHQPH